MGKKRKLQQEAWSSDDEYDPMNNFSTQINRKMKRRNRKPNKFSSRNGFYDASSESGDEFEYSYEINSSTQKDTQMRVNDQAIKKLRAEIDNFSKYIAPVPVELEIRRELFNQIENIILSVYPRAHVALYGSSTSSLSTFRSDLDITLGNLEHPIQLTEQDQVSLVEDDNQDANVLQKYAQEDEEEDDDSVETNFSLNLDLSSSHPNSDSIIDTPAAVALKKKQKKVFISPWNSTHRRKKIRILSSIYTLIKSKMPTLKLKLLSKAKIPIIMCEDTISNVSIDVGLHREAYDECDHGQTTALVDTIRQRFDGFYAVVLFLKELLNLYDLDKTYAGGIGSFRLYIMVASIYLKKHATKKKTSCTVEILLMFFQVYGDPSFLYGSRLLSLPSPYECMVDFEPVFRLEECCALFQEVSGYMEHHIHMEDGHKYLYGELYTYFYSHLTRSARERSRNDAMKAIKRIKNRDRHEELEAKVVQRGPSKKRKKKHHLTKRSSTFKS
jgi:hypothetical protein